MKDILQGDLYLPTRNPRVTRALLAHYPRITRAALYASMDLFIGVV